MQEAIPLFRQRGAKGVILDVRFNSGGSDFIGMTVASHFFTERALGFSKRSRLPMAGQHSTKCIAMWLSKRKKRPFYRDRLQTMDESSAGGMSLLWQITKGLTTRSLGQTTQLIL